MSGPVPKSLALKSLFLSGALALAPAAGASPVEIVWQDEGQHFEQGQYAVVEFVSGPEGSPAGDDRLYAAGAFALTGWERVGPGDGDWVPQDFVAFCIDIFTTISLPAGYWPSLDGAAFGFDSGRLTNLELLFNTAYTTLDFSDGIETGAFQIAIWEILYEDSGELDVLEGSFSVASSAALRANEMLTDLWASDVDGDFRLTFLAPPQREDGLRMSQRLVTTARLPSPVPLPAGGLLLLAGLAGLGVAGRRRRAT